MGFGGLGRNAPRVNQNNRFLSEACGQNGAGPSAYGI